jgi:hypothetical protein
MLRLPDLKVPESGTIAESIVLITVVPLPSPGLPVIILPDKLQKWAGCGNLEHPFLPRNIVIYEWNKVLSKGQQPMLS